MADESTESTATSDSSATESSKTDTKQTDEPLGDAGKAALQREREAREAAEKETKRLKRLVDDAEAANARAAEAEAVKRGEFEQLATDRQARIVELEAEIAKRDRQSLRDKVAAKHGLVEKYAELADLITGETEEEMTAKAKTLAAHILPKKAADTEAGKRGNATNGTRTDASASATTTYAWMPPGAVTIPD